MSNNEKYRFQKIKTKEETELLNLFEVGGKDSSLRPSVIQSVTTMVYTPDASFSHGDKFLVLSVTRDTSSLINMINIINNGEPIDLFSESKRLIKTGLAKNLVDTKIPGIFTDDTCKTSTVKKAILLDLFRMSSVLSGIKSVSSILSDINDTNGFRGFYSDIDDFKSKKYNSSFIGIPQCIYDILENEICPNIIIDEKSSMVFFDSLFPTVEDIIPSEILDTRVDTLSIPSVDSSYYFGLNKLKEFLLNHFKKINTEFSYLDLSTLGLHIPIFNISTLTDSLETTFNSIFIATNHLFNSLTDEDLTKEEALSAIESYERFIVEYLEISPLSALI